MRPNPAVLADLASVRSESAVHATQRRELLHVAPFRPLLDIAMDGAVVVAAFALVAEAGAWWTPLAIVLIGNRQRALGNILHDAGHRNLSRNPRVNDLIAGLFVAPFVFASLAQYRATHYRHHQALGEAGRDPDILPCPQSLAWWATYLRNLASWPAWRGSLLGDLVNAAAGFGCRAYIVAWWTTLVSAVSLIASPTVALACLGLWLLSRATVFHAITTFREMCDHVGLQPGGIFSFTRDVACHCIWRLLIHPRNNGYHLTHHLCPAVPYYRLPHAQKLFALTPSYRKHAVVCNGYFGGRNPVVAAWGQARA